MDNTSLIFIFIAVIIIVILLVNKRLDSKRFITEVKPYFSFLLEDDYEFLLKLKYGPDIDTNKLYEIRLRNAFIALATAIIIFINKINFLYIVLSLIIAYVIFKEPYIKLKNFYKRHLYKINLLLPYYLKSLEILIQHYTVPVALSKSIATAPEIFKDGLIKLVEKIDAGDSTVEPYMDFAREYPVKDSMRMMRLLYRLSLGSQEEKEEQLIMLSKNISTLQNQSRAQKYQDRLDKMEKKTMLMLTVTGMGIIVILLVAMMSNLNI